MKSPALVRALRSALFPLLAFLPLALLAGANAMPKFTAANLSAARRVHAPATAGGTDRDQPGGSDILQFTSGGHILGFAADGVYVASGSHALTRRVHQCAHDQSRQ